VSWKRRYRKQGDHSKFESLLLGHSRFKESFLPRISRIAFRQQFREFRSVGLLRESNLPQILESDRIPILWLNRKLIDCLRI